MAELIHEFRSNFFHLFIKDEREFEDKFYYFLENLYNKYKLSFTEFCKIEVDNRPSPIFFVIYNYHKLDLSIIKLILSEFNDKTSIELISKFIKNKSNIIRELLVILTINNDNNPLIEDNFDCQDKYIEVFEFIIENFIIEKNNLIKEFIKCTVEFCIISKKIIDSIFFKYILDKLLKYVMINFGEYNYNFMDINKLYYILNNDKEYLDSSTNIIIILNCVYSCFFEYFSNNLDSNLKINENYILHDFIELQNKVIKSCIAWFDNEILSINNDFIFEPIINSIKKMWYNLKKRNVNLGKLNDKDFTIMYLGCHSNYYPIQKGFEDIHKEHEYVFELIKKIY